MVFLFLCSSCLRLSAAWPYCCRQRSLFQSRLEGITSICLSPLNFQRSLLVAPPLIPRCELSFLLCCCLEVPHLVSLCQDLPLCLIPLLLLLLWYQAWQCVFLLLLVSVFVQERRWVMCFLTVKESTSSFFVGFICGGVRWRAKGTAGGGDMKVTGGQYGG